MTAQGSQYDEEKVDEAVLALLYLDMWKDGRPPFGVYRVWKSFLWEAMDRLYEIRERIHRQPTEQG